jgi:hypothetical protein
VAASRAVPVVAICSRAQARLRRIAGRALLTRSLPLAALLASVVAAARPISCPLGSVPLWAALICALALFAGAVLAFGLALAFLGRRRGPTPLAAARAIDRALGTKEVVASGWAFEQARADGPMVELARARAAEAVRGFDVVKAFPLPALRPSRRRCCVVAAAALAGIVVGSYDPALVAGLVSRPSAEEVRAANALERAAARLARGAGRSPTATDRSREPGGQDQPRPHSARAAGEPIARRARDAARAAQRGDREAALRSLDELGRLAEARSADARSLDDVLERIARALRPTAGAGDSSTARPPDPGRALRALARDLDRSRTGSDQSDAELRRASASLAEAAAEAGRASRTSTRPTADGRESAELVERARQALERAAEALARGDRQAAAQALEEAARRSEAHARARAEAESEAEAVAALLEASGALERAVQLALARRRGDAGEQGQGSEQMGLALGQQGQGASDPGGNGDGEGQALARALARRLAAMGQAESQNPEGPFAAGGHIPDRGDGLRGGLRATGSGRVPGQARDGERAVLAIRGLGRSEAPATDYQEIYPGYAAVAEESIQDETVPLARREAVRIYFEAIRPGGSSNSAEGGAEGE